MMELVQLEAPARGKLPPPLVIGPVTIDPPLILAPMSGVTGVPFRLLCREHGAGLVCNEFISGYGLFYENRRSGEMLLFEEAERPVSSQIFGADPAKLAVAAAKVEQAGADILDLNLGCSVRKVVANGAGACLLRHPRAILEIVAAMVAAVSIPVTVKIRLGWDERTRNAVDTARAAVDAGARAVTVHGRTASQAYEGRADWHAIGEVKAALTVPVIGNGDVRTPDDAARLLATAGCDAVMIGRGAQGNPWIFARTAAYLRTGVAPREPGADERLETARRHGELMVRYKGDDRGTREMRRHLGWYVTGLPGSARFREQSQKLSRWCDMAELIAEYRAELTLGAGAPAAGA